MWQTFWYYLDLLEVYVLDPLLWGILLTVVFVLVFLLMVWGSSFEGNTVRGYKVPGIPRVIRRFMLWGFFLFTVWAVGWTWLN